MMNERYTYGESRSGSGVRTLVSAVLLGFFSIHHVSGATAAPTAFYVGSHGWHTSIIVPRRQIRAGAWPRGVATKTFAGFDYLEIGWGDRKFYTAPKPNVAMALDAVLLPEPSVLHIVGLNPPLDRALPWSALITVPCTDDELANLCRALGESFDRDGNGDVTSLGRGLYGKTSRFYAARGRYYLFNTCDTWTARMMRAGGLPADSSVAGTWNAGRVIVQARRLVARRNTFGRLHPNKATVRKPRRPRT